MKLLGFVSLMCFSLTSCVVAMGQVDYKPNPANVTNPIEILKATIEQQPTAYAYMPVDLEVDEHCIKLYMQSSRPRVMPIVGGNGGTAIGPGESYVAPETVCYKNVGKVVLSQIAGSNSAHLWRVEINDKIGNYMYWVYTFEQAEAERFIDALSYMVSNYRK